MHNLHKPSTVTSYPARRLARKILAENRPGVVGEVFRSLERPFV